MLSTVDISSKVSCLLHPELVDQHVELLAELVVAGVLRDEVNQLGFDGEMCVRETVKNIAPVPETKDN